MERAVERRAHRRISGNENADMARGRVRPGRPADIIDVSEGGALIETEWRLAPGMQLDLQFGEPPAIRNVRGRVLRCHVSHLERARVRYRGAVLFEERVPFSVGQQVPRG